MQDVTIELAGGKQIKFETGRMAKQASGAAFTTSGDDAVLATAVASPDPKEGIYTAPVPGRLPKRNTGCRVCLLCG